MIWTVTKKELRGYFNSAVAVIFLAAFLVVAFYTFFWREKFFARGLADLRPLFEWMPKLLIIIVSALAMRLWSEEKRTGTLEILLTLPIPKWKLVLGKFVAGLMLIAVALGLTLGLPITISMMGDLDPGPVFGGYLAALLLSGAYLSIGMCVSAATDNQIVAFVGTALLCVIAYAVGGDGSSEWQRFLGTGTRFDSVARGVLDLRDLAYYGSIISIGIAVNVLLLERATRSKGPRARPKRIASLVTVGLVIANAVLLNLWLAPIYRTRIDLTKGGSYSLSSSTKKILGELQEKVIIRGYFSERTHPKLTPLIPQVRDLFEEYRLAGRGNIEAEVVDPTESTEIKREAKDRFGIQPTSLPFATDTENTIVDAYFTIAIQYGDQQVVLPLDQLIAQRRSVNNESEVTLRNPEYTITKAIKKVATQFTSIDSLFAQMTGKAELIAIATPKSLSKDQSTAYAAWKKVSPEIKKLGGDKIDISELAPTTEEQVFQVVQKYKVTPTVQQKPNGQLEFSFFRLLLKIGDRRPIPVGLPSGEELTDAAVKKAIVEAIKKAAPGFQRVIGMWSPQPPEMPEGMQMRRPPPPQTFRALRESLASAYEVRDTALTARIPDDIDVLVLGGPADLDAKSVEHIDQFVMRGGALVVLAGRHRFSGMQQQKISVEKVKTGLEDAFKKWGITLGDDLVRDEKAAVIPLPYAQDVGDGEIVEGIRPTRFDTFLSVASNQLSASSLITQGLSSAVIMHWTTNVTATKPSDDDSSEAVELMTTSDKAWISPLLQVHPDFKLHAETGFPPPAEGDKRGAQTLAVAVRGSFPSAVAKPTEVPGASAGSGSGSGSAAGDKKTMVERSPPDTRIVVFGSSSFVEDNILQFTEQTLNVELSNQAMVLNAIDWTVADNDLLAIRARVGAHPITIEPDERGKWRNVNLGLAFVLLAMVVGAAYGRRRTVKSVMGGQS